MQALKTGALLYFSCIAPAIAAGADKKSFDALSRYAQAIGLLFQITDDILDVEGDTNIVGKTLRKDSEAHKSTFVSVLGMEKARQLANNLTARAREALTPFGHKSDILDVLTTFILERKR
jgi:geranylgeranyl pyrophosphate synthase